MYAVFAMPNLAGAYWGIEETRFVDAPILASPDLTRKLDGRTYQFYFNGSHIHMIAIVQGGVAYWVQNTLRDDLSNPDMIAIARSLQPGLMAEQADRSAIGVDRRRLRRPGHRRLLRRSGPPT